MFTEPNAEKYIANPGISLRFGHKEGNSVLFCDGHVIWTKEYAMSLSGAKVLPIQWYQVKEPMY
jgi:prepilin-type processing-associated H-X9-DG protein